MISTSEAIARFKEILGTKGSWGHIAESQFIHHLSVFVSWCLRQSLWAVERCKQEFWISTAANRSSLLAHIEDRDYVPHKAIPSAGKCLISNRGEAPVYIPAGQAFLSGAQLYYEIEDQVSVLGGTATEVTVRQVERAERNFVVTEKRDFYQILLSAEDSERVADFDVFVDIGDGFQPWTLSRLFRDALPGANVFDEFYSHLGQIGIRFGNDSFGQVLPVGANIRIDLRLTDGDTYLSAGQPLDIVGELLDLSGFLADLTITTNESIDGGSGGEPVESSRQALKYWASYAEKIVWDDDYVFYLKKRIPSILWINVWGEQEAEAVYGVRYEHINTIFVSAYAKDAPDLGEDVMEILSGLPLLNRRFRWVDPIFSSFGLAITGRVAPGAVVGDARADILDALELNYGKNSLSRLDNARIKDFYRIVSETGYFPDDKTSFEIVVSGTLTATGLNEMVSIDLGATTVALESL